MCNRKRGSTKKARAELKFVNLNAFPPCLFWGEVIFRDFKINLISNLSVVHGASELQNAKSCNGENLEQVQAVMIPRVEKEKKCNELPTGDSLTMVQMLELV